MDPFVSTTKTRTSTSWEITSPGTIQYGRQTITYDESSGTFIWRENDLERARFLYLSDAKRKAGNRQMDLSEIGLAEPKGESNGFV